MNWNIIIDSFIHIAIVFIYLFVYLFIFFQRPCMDALMTKIATLMQNAKMENAFVKEIDLEME